MITARHNKGNIWLTVWLCNDRTLLADVSEWNHVYTGSRSVLHSTAHLTTPVLKSSGWVCVLTGLANGVFIFNDVVLRCSVAVSSLSGREIWWKESRCMELRGHSVCSAGGEFFCSQSLIHHSSFQVWRSVQSRWNRAGRPGFFPPHLRRMETEYRSTDQDKAVPGDHYLQFNWETKEFPNLY